ncbi:MAG: hypothetical protein Q7K55_09510 [Candidatus Levybacteria bacterium]|nr:hypothetical protein [Candidatus Levybacteria bacterium]
MSDAATLELNRPEVKKGSREVEPKEVLLKKLLNLHREHLKMLPKEGADFFSTPSVKEQKQGERIMDEENPEASLKNIAESEPAKIQESIVFSNIQESYANLTKQEVTDLVNLCVEEDIMSKFGAEFDERIVGYFLRSLVDSHPDEVIATIGNGLPENKTVSTEQMQRIYSLIITSSDTDSLIEKTNFLSTMTTGNKLDDTIAVKNAALFCFRTGAMSKSMLLWAKEDDIFKAATQKDVSALKELAKAPQLLIKGDVTVEEITSVTEELNSLIALAETRDKADASLYLNSYDAKNLIEEAILDTDKVIEDSTLLLIKDEDFSGSDIAELIKTALKYHDWDSLNPKLKDALEEAFPLKEYKPGDFAMIISSYTSLPETDGARKDLPQFIQEYYSKPENQEVFIKFKDIIGHYYLDGAPLKNFLEKGFSSLPPFVSEKVKSFMQEGKMDVSDLSIFILNKLYSSVGFFDHSPDVTVDKATGSSVFTDLVNKDIWNIILKADDDTLFKSFSKNSFALNEGIFRDKDGNVYHLSYLDCMPEELIQRLKGCLTSEQDTQELLSLDKLDGKKLETFKFAIDDDFIKRFHAKDRINLLVKITGRYDHAMRSYSMLQRFQSENDINNAVIHKDGQEFLDSSYIKSLIKFIAKDYVTTNSSFIPDIKEALEVYNRLGMIDLSATSPYDIQDRQIFSLILSGEHNYIIRNYITKDPSNKEINIDFDNLFKDFSITDIEENGILKQKVSLNKESIPSILRNNNNGIDLLLNSADQGYVSYEELAGITYNDNRINLQRRLDLFGEIFKRNPIITSPDILKDFDIKEGIENGQKTTRYILKQSKIIDLIANHGETESMVKAGLTDYKTIVSAILRCKYDKEYKVHLLNRIRQETDIHKILGTVTLVKKMKLLDKDGLKDLERVYSSTTKDDPEFKKQSLDFIFAVLIGGEAKTKMLPKLFENAPELIANEGIRQFILPFIDTLAPLSKQKIQMLLNFQNIVKDVGISANEFSVMTRFIKNLPQVPEADDALDLVADVIYTKKKQIDILKEALSSEDYKEEDSRKNALRFILEASTKDLSEIQLERIPDLIRNTSMLIKKWETRSLVFEHFDKLATLSKEQIAPFVEVINRINDSPSQEIQKLKKQLLDQIMETNDPVLAFNRIEDVFIKNNLPLVGKVFKIFDILHPHDVLKGKLKTGSSPMLSRSEYIRGDYDRQKDIIFRDLIKVHILSGNLSLRDYATALSEGAEVLDEVMANGELSEREERMLSSFLDKMDTLYANSTLGRNSEIERQHSAIDLREKSKEILTNFGVKEGQTVSDRITEMFLRSIGVESVEEMLELMNRAKKEADIRNREQLKQVTDGHLTIKAGDMLKGVGDGYFEDILQNGSVAKEFLGKDSTSDGTPLDTDLSLILPQDAESFSTAFSHTLATSYGQILLGIRNRGQFVITTADSKPDIKYDAKHYELFPVSGKIGDRHYGIRTGFASTEIDFVIAMDTIISDRRKLENIFYDIAENGFYIPVVDSAGKVIFTPEMYDEYRHVFDGVSRYSESGIRILTSNSEKAEDLSLSEEVVAKHKENVSHLLQEIKDNIPVLDNVKGKVRESIQAVLDKYQVKLREEFEMDIRRADLLDTGSTGRYTNIPGDCDFDLMLLLYSNDFKNVQEIFKALKEKLKPKKDDSHSNETEGYYQVRAKSTREVVEEPIDIDIGITRSSELKTFGSQDAISTKLDWIRKNLGDDAYFEVITNIVLAKKILKEGGAYKKVEHGGFGGIGTENWILQHEGNMLLAFKSFWNAAHDKSGNTLSFEEFKKRYKILDAGTNIKFTSHDNFVHVLKENGYQQMLKVIGGYLKFI